MTACNCTNKSGCEVRIARGLVPFCQMAASNSVRTAVWGSYSAAVQANPGRWIRSVTGHNGSAKAFVAV